MAVDNLQGVEAVFRILNIFREEFNSNDFCNSVTIGNLTEVDLAKMTMFPLAHISIESVRHNDNSLTFSLTILNLDSVNISKESEVKTGYNNDDLIYKLNNQLYVINRAILRINSRIFYDNKWQIENANSDVVNKEYENMIAGYSTTMQVTVPNNLDRCNA